MSEQMRSEFEAWFRENYSSSINAGRTGFSLTRFADHPHQYEEDRAHHDCRVWLASRAALVIELPPKITAEDAAECIDTEDNEQAVLVAKMVSGAISACGSFIKAKGVRVKESSITRE